MPVPTSIYDLSATPSSNYPGGGDSPSTLDDYIRAHGAIIRQVSDAKANTASPTFTGTTTVADVSASGNVKVSSPAGLGYGTGSGGTVTQATSKSTAVTLNKPTGLITMNAASLAANTWVYFTLNNSLITDKDVLVVNLSGNGYTDYLTKTMVSNGSAVIGVKNDTAGALAATVFLSFAVIKGATA